MPRAERLVPACLLAATLLALAPLGAQAQGEGAQAPLGRWRTFPSLRIGGGVGFSPEAGNPVGIAHDLTLGIRVFRAGGILYGVDLGYTVGRRNTDPGLNAAVVGVPVGWVSRRNRFQVGGRVDLLAGRWDAVPTYGLRASAFVGLRHSLFLEGGLEQRWDDGASRQGGRVLLVVDLGVLVSSSGFLRVALH